MHARGAPTLVLPRRDVFEENTKPQSQRAIRRGNVAGVAARIKSDFKRSYFVTGAAGVPAAWDAPSRSTVADGLDDAHRAAGARGHWLGALLALAAQIVTRAPRGRCQ
jgi:hypothetical protein